MAVGEIKPTKEINIISPLLTMVNQLRVFHWQTKSYAEHQAFGSTYDTLNSLIDGFIEVYFGKYGRLFTTDEFEIELENLSSPETCIAEWVNYLLTELPSYLSKEKDSDLLNIRDEMLASLNKLKYLLTLK